MLITEENKTKKLTQQINQHLGPHHQEEDGEELFEPAHRQIMGQAGAQGSGEDAASGDAQEGRQVDIAQRPGRQVGCGQAVDKIADGAGYGNGKADGRGGADCRVDRDIAMDHERHGEAAAADAHEGGDHADDHSHPKHAPGTGEGPAGFGLPVQQELNTHVVQEDYKNAL